MILMTMSDNQCFNFLLITDNVRIIRNDVIYSQKIFFRKADTGINYDNIIFVFDTIHVLADFAKTA
ncbi:hypothetical protein SDC9_128630 [bioreactor metagenome]|uniref:Uncharacterized protein n=1 Tax=bioreactor metagenome TaxID=1076179 RepID=A0A645CWR7_9ZZZZ